jgi:hypothetical protein
MSKKQTAIEWLEEIYLTTGIDRNVHFNQAKLMECEQIIEAHAAGRNDRHNDFSREGQGYYEDVYGVQ